MDTITSDQGNVYEILRNGNMRKKLLQKSSQSSGVQEGPQPTKDEEDIGKDEPMFSYRVFNKHNGIDVTEEFIFDGTDYWNKVYDDYKDKLEMVVCDQSRYQVKLQLSEKVLDNITKELTERICRYDSGGLIKEIIKKHLNQKTS